MLKKHIRKIFRKANHQAWRWSIKQKPLANNPNHLLINLLRQHYSLHGSTGPDVILSSGDQTYFNVDYTLLNELIRDNIMAAITGQTVGTMLPPTKKTVCGNTRKCIHCGNNTRDIRCGAIRRKSGKHCHGIPDQ